MVKSLGAKVEAKYSHLVSEKNPLLVLGILNGSFIFMADLVRTLCIPLEVDFIRLSSYEDRTVSSQQVVMLKAPERSLEARHILVIDDIADCGLTLAWMQGFLFQKNPYSIKFAVAVDKSQKRKVPINIDFIGFEDLSPHFIVGYGLDYAQKYRNQPALYHMIPN
jgi:hypoxanthine phosphoribosyltransferase